MTEDRIDGRHRRATNSRQAVLNAARDEWAKAKTPFDVTAKMIADRAGVSSRNLFRHYRSLADLWLAVQGIEAEDAAE